MPRYIDANILLKKIYPLDLVDKRLYTINAKAVEDAIAKTPTADVAPRSELAILSVQNAALEKAKFELQQELEAYKGLKKILDTAAAELKKKYIGEQTDERTDEN